MSEPEGHVIRMLNDSSKICKKICSCQRCLANENQEIVVTNRKLIFIIIYTTGM